MGERLLTLPNFSCCLIGMVIIRVIMGGAIVLSSNNMVIGSLYGGHIAIIMA